MNPSVDTSAAGTASATRTVTIASAKNFAAAFAVAMKALNRYTIVPILSCALLEYNGKGRLRATVSNLENTVSVTVPAESEEEAFRVAIDAKQLHTFAKSAKHDFSLDVTDKTVTVRTETNRTELFPLPAAEYPQMRRSSWTDEETIAQYSSSLEQAQEILASAASIASTEEARGAILQGNYLDMDAGRVVATDGYGMFIDESPFRIVTGESEGIILPRGTSAIIAAIKVGKDQKVSALKLDVTGQNRVSFSVRVGDVVYCINSRTIDGTYPNYAQIAPSADAPAYRFTANRKVLTAALKGAMSTAKNGAHLTRMSIDRSFEGHGLPGTLRITSSNYDTGAYEANVTVTDTEIFKKDYLNETTFTMAFNAKMFIRQLASYDDELVTISFHDVIQPCRIASATGTRTGLLMPLRDEPARSATPAEDNEDDHQDEAASDSSAA